MPKFPSGFWSLFFLHFCPDSWRCASNSLPHLSSCQWSWILLTKRSSSLDITTWDVFSGFAIDWLATSVPHPSRIFTTWTSRTGPTVVPSKALGFRIRSRTGIFSAPTSNVSPSVVSTWSNFVLLSSDHKMLEEGFFTQLRKLRLFSGVWKLNAPPCVLFPGAWVGGDTNNSTSSGSTMVKILLSTIIPTCHFLLLSRRIVDTNSQLLRWH